LVVDPAVGHSDFPATDRCRACEIGDGELTLAIGLVDEVTVAEGADAADTAV
jgi:hypothetical protein